MTLRWFGQSCFLLTTAGGARLLMDPFRRFLGYSLPPLEADVVTISHDHPDHNAAAAGGPSAAVVSEAGERRLAGIGIRGIGAWHGAKRGPSGVPNVIFVIEADGLRICHCGDLGHDLDPERLASIGKIDVLLVPCGGMASAGPELAATLVERIAPSIAVPMHYRTGGLGAAGIVFAPVEKFLKACPLPVRRETELRLDAAPGGAGKEIVILDWKGGRGRA